MGGKQNKSRTMKFEIRELKSNNYTEFDLIAIIERVSKNQTAVSDINDQWQCP